jgi:hypothetical protein
VKRGISAQSVVMTEDAEIPCMLPERRGGRSGR